MVAIWPTRITFAFAAQAQPDERRREIVFKTLGGGRGSQINAKRDPRADASH